MSCFFYFVVLYYLVDRGLHIRRCRVVGSGSRVTRKMESGAEERILCTQRAWWLEGSHGDEGCVPQVARFGGMRKNFCKT